MRGGVALLGLLAASPAAAASEAASPFGGIPHVTIAYRPIAGATLDALSAALEASADHPAQGGSSYAHTDWSIRWHWHGAGAGAACRIRSVEMTFGAVVTLPRLAEAQALDPTLAARWDAFAAAIARHEAGHARRAWAGVPAVRRAILAASCDFADAAGRAAVHQVTLAQADYDRATRNGATQGAHFP